MPDRIEPPTWDAYLQPVMNAWAIPASWTECPYPAGPIPVRVRLVWRDDGVEWMDGRAMAWTERLVLVQVRDRRLSTNAVWVEAHDVRRREGDRAGESRS